MLLIMLLLVTLLRSVALLMALPICCDKNVPAAGLLGPRLFVAGSFGPKVISNSCVRVRLAVANGAVGLIVARASFHVGVILPLVIT